MLYKKYEGLRCQSLYELKANSKEENLKFLDELVNGAHGKVIQHLEGGYIQKIIPKIVKTHNKSYEKYGHLVAGKNAYPYRISTCLKNDIIYFPISELQYFEYGSYIYFTNGDLFLIVCTKLLLQNRLLLSQSFLNNYEVKIVDLFTNNIVRYFGLIDKDKVEYYDFVGIHKTLMLTQDLPLSFLSTKLRSCVSSFNHKYVGLRLENADSPAYLEYFFSNCLQALVDNLKGPSTTQGMGLIIKNTTENFENEKVNLKNIIKKNDNISYIVMKYNNYDIEKMRKYVQQFIPKPKQINYRLRAAVKKAKICNNNEEYSYYKTLFLQCHGEKQFYTENDIQLFKDLY